MLVLVVGVQQCVVVEVEQVECLEFDMGVVVLILYLVEVGYIRGVKYDGFVVQYYVVIGEIFC